MARLSVANAKKKYSREGYGCLHSGFLSNGAGFIRIAIRHNHQTQPNATPSWTNKQRVTRRGTNKDGTTNNLH